MKHIIVAMLLLFVLVACQSTTVEISDKVEVVGELEDEVVQDEPEVEDEPKEEPANVPVVEEPEVAEPEDTTKEFTMVARQWEFVPDTITVNEGDTVKLTVKSEDVAHGISIPAFGVANTFLDPGDEVTLEFVADRKGTHRFFCTVFCGSGHGGMTGQVVVQ